MQNILWMRKIGCAILLLGLVVFAPYPLQAQENTKSIDKTLKKLAVIPFQAVHLEDGSSTVRCPVCGSVNSSGTIVKGAEKIVEEIFTGKLKDLKDVEIISSARVAGAYQRISTDSLKQPLSKIIQKVGNELHADVLAVGFVYRYRERVGYDYSAERPASVAFEIHLISVKDGSTLWRGIYDNTQKSLMEDVLQAPSFFKGGAKWVTARELARIGIDDVFKTFPGFER
ncbi:MAG: hypothetical protein CVU71_06055 [Deltaproteobacteria bacterium HGW-Deltaproteobacteria-6]|nr:MAG: hypothetical protein CVU71_06055 [Deltaproteobacteria bacterium HGW-Deltaproteobacteria-6]